MENQQRTSVILRRPLIEIREQGTLIITEQFLNQLKYLCNKISEVEWSGLVFFSTKGEPNDLNSFIITPYYVHLMDKGTGGSTEFDDDGSQKELYEAMPELDPFAGNNYRYGKIHSHHSMEVFHSPTDMQDLQDQSEAYKEYYLSVIVNNYMDIDVKMAFVAEIPDQKIHPKKFKGMDWTLPKKEVLVTVDFDIEVEGADLVIPIALKERVEEVTTYVPSYETPRWGSSQLGLGMGDEEYGRQYDVNEYRTAQGKIAIRDFLHTFFDEKVPILEVYDQIESMTPTGVEALNKDVLEWFEKLGDWTKQNIILYIEDVDLGDDEKVLKEVFETIWATIKVKEK